MILFPSSKINLGLRVLSKRADGYHDIETCFYPLALCDILEGISSESVQAGFTSSGLDIPGEAEENLIVRGYKILNERFNLPPLALHLHKIIPMGAGLGGGSSDGTKALLLIRDLFQLAISKEEIVEIAMTLGSDCAFFMEENVCLATGRGEVLTPIQLSLKGWNLAVVKPEIHVSTAAVFAMMKPQARESSLASLLSFPLSKWKDQITNDFEPIVFAQHPRISAIKDKLYTLGASFALMSGSGASVYGLFSEQLDLQSCFPDDFVYQETLQV